MPTRHVLLATVVVLMAVVTDASQAQPTFTVDTFHDTPAATPGDGTCADAQGACSLRAAIDEANALGAATIVLLPGTYSIALDVPGEDSNAGGDFDLLSDVTIEGSGSDETVVDGADLDRVLFVGPEATVTIRNLTVTGGRSPDAQVGGDPHGRPGGGIFNRGTLTLESVTVVENATGRGRIGFNSPITGGRGGAGGGIASNGTLTLIDVTIADNSTGMGGTGSQTGGDGGAGGGLFVSGIATLERVTVSGNTTSTGGSGPYGSGNAGVGAGIYNGGTLTAVNSTISGNQSGGGSWAHGYGGGLYNSTSTGAALSAVTVTANQAPGGGGLYNASGVIAYRNTLVAGNTSTVSSAHADCGGPGETQTHGHNLTGDGTGCPFSFSGDITVAAASVFGSVLAETLAQNEGTTYTHALLNDSPAIDAGICLTVQGNSLTEDQRGAARPSGLTCDIGAFEFGSEVAVPIDSEAIAGTIDLAPSYPNPFTTSTSIRFTLPRAAPVRLEVYDLMGRRVAVLAEGSYPAGEHTAQWSGRTADGAPAASGLYVYRLEANGESRAHRVLLVR